MMNNLSWFEILGRAEVFWNRTWVARLIATALVTVAAASLPPTILMAQEGQLANEELLEEVIVTGSRIKRDTFTSSSPVAVVDSANIEGLGATDTGNLLARLPSIVSSTDGTSANVVNRQSTGIHTIALRNLGASRTLVLVNGRRYVSGTSAGAGYGVDLNSIPTTMIDRVEILTGSQSAVYGSDALAGVVNIITKSDFEGIQVNAQFGQSAEADREQVDLNLTAGKSFGGDGDGNVWFSAGYSNDEGLLSSDREFARISERPIDTDSDGLNDTMAFLGSSHVPGARLVGGGLSLHGDGTPFNASRDPATSDLLNFNAFRNMLIPMERSFAAAGMNFAIGNNTDISMETNYARVESEARMEPAPLSVVNDVFKVNRGGSTGIDLTTSPLFVGSSAGQQLVDAGVTSLDDVNTFRRTNELGQLGPRNTRDTFRFAAAVDHDFDNGMSLNVYGTYGATDQNQVNFGDMNLARIRQALDLESDGNGGFQCSDEVARMEGCVPVNPFGTVDSIAGQAGITGFSPEAIKYVRGATGIVGSVEQTVLSASLTGDLPFKISSDAAAFAAGVEWREESGEEQPDALRQAGIARDGNIESTAGSFNVLEAFGEVQFPVTERITLDFAGRVGDYSTVGNLFTWKAGLDAAISDSLRLRAAVSTAVRAPNISDLFAGRVGNAGAILDPCIGIDNSTSGALAENCRSIPAIQQRIDDTGAWTLSQVERNNTGGFTSGSPDTEEETADSYTLGFVFTPINMEKFSLAVDYYQIEIEDAIVVPAANVVLERCHDVSTDLFDPTCGGKAMRDPRQGPLLEVLQVTNNEDTIETSGLDIEAAYNFDNFATGNLLVSLTANLITQHEVTGAAGDVEDLKGEILFPETRLNLNANYSTGNFGLFTQVRFRSSTKDRNDGILNIPNLNEFGAEYYVDMQGSYRISDSATIYLGARNLLDNDPPVMGDTLKYNQRGTGTNGTAFDVVGQYWYARVSLAF